MERFDNPKIFLAREYTLLTLSLPQLSQTKTIEVSLEALNNGSDASLPPLMNPAMLEASDDLTNLSYLNEPAGKSSTPARLATTPL